MLPFSVVSLAALKRLVCVTVVSSLILSQSTTAALAQSVQSTTTRPSVAILYDSNFSEEESLLSAINRYAAEVSQRVNGVSTLVAVDPDTSPRDIYEALNNWYFAGVDGANKEPLSGVIIIGDVPLPVVEKNGEPWATIWPYTDFVDPLYLWDEEQEFFRWVGKNEFSAEIWHGVINPPGAFADKVNQLKTFLEQNHRWHQGNWSVSEKVLFVDLNTQPEVVPADLLQKYKNWVKYAEEVVYERFTKHLLSDIQSSEQSSSNESSAENSLPVTGGESDIPSFADAAPPAITTPPSGTTDQKSNQAKSSIDGLLSPLKCIILKISKPKVCIPPSPVSKYGSSKSKLKSQMESSLDIGLAQVPGTDQNQNASSSAETSNIPDVQSKLIFLNLLQRYQEIYRNWITEVNTIITQAGRWQPADIESTPRLVSLRDEWAVQTLRQYNDQLEQYLAKELDSSQVAMPLTSLAQEDFVVEGTENYSPISGTTYAKLPRYWHGQAQSNLQSKSHPWGISVVPEHCSLYRGSARSESNPLSQQVEANEVFNVLNTDKNVSLSSGSVACIPDGLKSDIFSDRQYVRSLYNNSFLYDELQGCCNLNLSSDEDGTTTYEASTFASGGQTYYQGCHPELNQWRTIPSYKSSEEDPYVQYLGPRKSILNLAATKEKSGRLGARGCAPIRLDYPYVIHNERVPTLSVSTNVGNFSWSLSGTNQDFYTQSAPFASLSLNVEPTAETIAAQQAAQYSRALPIDNPRSASFYDWQQNFRTIEFPNLFEFSAENWQQELDQALSSWQSKTNQSILSSSEQTTLRSSIEQSTPAAFFSEPIDGRFSCDSSWEIETQGSSLIGRQYCTATDSTTSTKTVSDSGTGTSITPSLPTCSLSSATADFTLLDGSSGTVTSQCTSGSIGTSTSCSTSSIDQTQTCTTRYSRTHTATIRFPVRSFSVSLPNLSSVNVSRSAIFSAENQSQIADALEWMELDHAEKNLRVLKLALSDPGEGKAAFSDPTHQGYELVVWHGQGTPHEGMVADFSPRSSGGIDLDYQSQLQKVRPLPSPNNQGIQLLGGKKVESLLGNNFSAENSTNNTSNQNSNADPSTGGTNNDPADQASGCESQSRLGPAWLGYIGCWFSESANPAPVTLNTGPEAGYKNRTKPLIVDSHHLHKGQIGSIVLSRPQLSLNPRVTTPLTASVLDLQGELRASDHSSQLRLQFEPQSIADQVEVIQAPTVVGGKMTFLLTPKTKISSDFKIFVTRENNPQARLSSAKIPVTVSDYHWRLPLNSSVTVDQRILFSLEVLKNGTRTTELDGQEATLTLSPGITIKNSPTTKIENGFIRWGLEAGQAAQEIRWQVTPSFSSLPIQGGTLDILPDKPHHLELWKDSPYFFRDQSLPIKAVMVDQFGNAVQAVHHKLSWVVVDGNIMNAEVIDQSTATPGVQQRVVGGTGEVSIFPRKNAASVKIKVTSSLFPDQPIQETFSVTTPRLELNVAQAPSLVAGGSQGFALQAQLKADNGSIVTEKLAVDFQTSPAATLLVPQPLYLQDGRANFMVYPGEKAGISTLQLGSPGITSEPLSVEVLPSEAHQLAWLGSQDFYEISAENQPISLELRVIDRFGNTVNDYENQIYLLPDQGTKGLFSWPTTTISNTAQNGYLPPYDERSISVRAVNLENGKATINLPAQAFNGQAKIIAFKDGLIPAETVFTLATQLTPQEISNWNPHSLVTAFLSLGSSDLSRPENFANQYLFSGKTQAVVSSANLENKAPTAGIITPDGRLSESVQVDWAAAPNTSIIFKDQNQKTLATLPAPLTQWQFAKSETDFQTAGWYFVPAGKFSAENSDQTLLINDTPIIKKTAEGGWSKLDNAVSITPYVGSWRRWNVEQSGTTLGWFWWHEPALSNQWLAENLNLKSPTLKVDFPAWLPGSTTDEPGIAWRSTNQTISREQQLGGPSVSVEDARDPALGWDTDWKPFSLFAGGQAIGSAAQFGATDALTILGDPSVKIKKATAQNQNTGGFNPTLGQLIWKSPEEAITGIFPAHIDADKNIDLLVQTGSEIHGLYNHSPHWRAQKPIFDQRALKVLPRSQNPKEDPEKAFLDDLIMLDQAHQLWWHRNDGKQFSAENITPPAPVGKVVDFWVLALNRDNESDLMLLDENQDLWLRFAYQDSWLKSQKFINLSPRFEPFTESITEPDPLSQIDTAPAERLSQGAALLPLFRASYEGLASSEVPSITTQENGEETPWATLPNIPAINANLSADLSPGASRASLGSRVQFRLALFSAENLRDWRLKIPVDSRWELDPESFVCESCGTDWSAELMTNTGELEVRWSEFKTFDSPVLEWEAVINSTPPSTVWVRPLDDDRIDDIVVPRTVDGDLNEFRYLSQPSEPQFINNNFTNPYLAQSSVVPIDTTPPAPDPLDETAGRALAEEIQKTLQSSTNTSSTDGSSTSGSDANRQNAISRLRDQVDSWLCGGGCDAPFPFSKALFAPGPVNFYIPPITIPAGFDFGWPLLAWPTTIYAPLPVPAIHPISPLGVSGLDNPLMPGGVYPSQGRIYIMPTTTQQVGIAFCQGIYAIAMMPPLWVPNCYMVIPPLAELGGKCEPPQGDLSEGTVLSKALTAVFSKRFGAMSVGGDGRVSQASGIFAAQQLPTSNMKGYRAVPEKHKGLSSLDPISKWVGNQTDEINRSFSTTPRFSAENSSSKSQDTANNSRTSYQPPLETPRPLVSSLNFWSIGNWLKAQSTAPESTPPPPSNETEDDGLLKIEKKEVVVFVPQFDEEAIKAEIEKTKDQKAAWDAEFESIEPKIDGHLERIKALKIKLGKINMPNFEAPSSDDDEDKEDDCGWFGCDEEEDEDDDCGFFGCDDEDEDEDDCGWFGCDDEEDEDGESSRINFPTIDLNLAREKRDRGEISQSDFEFLVEMEAVQTDYQTLAQDLQGLENTFSIDLPETKAEVDEFFVSTEGFWVDFQQNDSEFEYQLSDWNLNLQQSLSSFKERGEFINDFNFSIQLQSNDSVRNWEEFNWSLGNIGKIFFFLPSLFRAFTDSCSGCPIDRGTLQTWLISLLLSGLEIPIIKFPTLPDFNISTGLDGPIILEVPDLKVERTPAPLPDSPADDFGPEAFSNQVDKAAAPIDDAEDTTNRITELASPENIARVEALLGTGNNSSPQSSVSRRQDLSFESLWIIIAQIFVSTTLVQAQESASSGSSLLPEIPSIPNIPALPELPEIPGTGASASGGADSIAPLPVVPQPPELPVSILALLQFVELPAPFLDFLCLLRLAISPMPEWYLRPHLEQATGRSTLSLDLDFSLPELGLDQKIDNKIIEVLGTMSLSASLDFIFEFFENLNQETLGEESPTGESSVNRPGASFASAKTLRQSIPGGSAIYQWAKSQADFIREKENQTLSAPELWQQIVEQSHRIITHIPQQRKVLAFIQNNASWSGQSQYESNRQKIWAQYQSNQQQLAQFDQWLDQFSAENQAISQIAKEKSSDQFWNHPLVASRFSPVQLTAEDPQSVLLELKANQPTAQELPTVDDITDPIPLPESDQARGVDTNQVSSELPFSLYFVDKESPLPVPITEFPLEPRAQIAIADLDQDQNPEVIFSSGRELYLKSKSKIYSPLLPTATVKNIDLKTLKSYFTAGQKFEFSAENSSLSLNFQRWSRKDQYFELVMSRRPNPTSYIRGGAYPPAEPLERWSFTVESEPKPHEIKTFSSIITGIEGAAPQIQQPQLEILTNHGEEACADGSAEKSFYPNQVAIISQADNTRLYLKFPPEDGAGLLEEEIVLHRGERTYLKAAEICLSRGAAGVLTTVPSWETVVMEENQLLLPGSQFQLSAEQRVLLEVGGKYQVTVEPSQFYRWDLFQTDSSDISLAVPQPDAFQYGYLYEWGDTHPSAPQPYFWHNFSYPQDP